MHASRKLRLPLAGVLLALATSVSADGSLPVRDVSFTTLSITPYAIEGLTGDNHSYLYTTGRAPAGTRCPVWRIDTTAAAPVAPLQIGSIPNGADAATACNPSGIALDRFFNVYVADAAQGGVIWRLTNTDFNPSTPFVSGVPGTNGIAFDADGNLWTGDGTTGQGRVWRIATTGGTCEPTFNACVEAFRIPPLTNRFGVGRQVATMQTTSSTANPQPLVANGLAFTPRGDLYVADTARGAIWRVTFDRQGRLLTPMNCDTTFTVNTLCFANLLVAHPLLEGADGIAFDRAGNLWAAANERNAIVVVQRSGRVVEVFRNPANANGLRNAADTADGNRHILEFPTSPFLNGNRLCIAQSDGDRRDNSPRTAGEVNGGGPVGARGKVSCMDASLAIPGLPLPVH